MVNKILEDFNNGLRDTNMQLQQANRLNNSLAENLMQNVLEELNKEIKRRV